MDVLVNNAGFGAAGPVADLPLERQLDMIRVNVAALTHLTRLFLPGMIQRRSGGIFNVGSTAGFQPGPYMAVYYATKAYVLSFTEALAEESSAAGVRVTCLAPGPTATICRRSRRGDKLLFRLGTADASSVARAGYRGFRRGRLLVIPGLRNKLGPSLFVWRHGSGSGRWSDDYRSSENAAYCRFLMIPPGLVSRSARRTRKNLSREKTKRALSMDQFPAP